MKSQQQEQSIKTSCCDCAFAIYNGNTQTGCIFDRIKKFDNIVEAYNKDKEFFVLNRLCNYYRNKSWGYSSNDAKKVEQESATSFNVLINYSTLNDEKVDHIIQLINTTQYYDNKVNFTLFHNNENDDNVKDHVVKIIHSTSQNFHRMSLSLCYVREVFLSTFLKKTRNDFHILLLDDQILSFDISMIIDVNKYINDDFKRGIVFARNDIYCISNFAFKSYAFTESKEKTTYEENRNLLLEVAKKKKLFIEI